MADETVIEILNELLQHESRSLLPRLKESTVFVTWASAGEYCDVSAMIDDEMEHRAWLAEAISDLGGDPLPGLADIRTTNVHYLGLGYMLPQVLVERRRSLAFYESAAEQLSANERAAAVVARIVARKRRHVERLSELTEKMHQQTA
jgi:rubrerythrin